jgi:hypothetical protein
MHDANVTLGALGSFCGLPTTEVQLNDALFNFKWPSADSSSFLVLNRNTKRRNELEVGILLVPAQVTGLSARGGGGIEITTLWPAPAQEANPRVRCKDEGSYTWAKSLTCSRCFLCAEHSHYSAYSRLDTLHA